MKTDLMIRHAGTEDIPAILRVYDAARAFMRSVGNMQQWINGYPDRGQVEEDIRRSCIFVMTDLSGDITAAFSLIPGPDPTYGYIEDGGWPSDEPYYVIHRLASDGRYHGVADLCFRWSLERCSCLRVDTHADNKVMQHLLVKNGFKRCGIIYISDGSARIAYQK